MFFVLPDQIKASCVGLGHVGGQLAVDLDQGGLRVDVLVAEEFLLRQVDGVVQDCGVRSDLDAVDVQERSEQQERVVRPGG